MICIIFSQSRNTELIIRESELIEEPYIDFNLCLIYNITLQSDYSILNILNLMLIQNYIHDTLDSILAAFISVTLPQNEKI